MALHEDSHFTTVRSLSPNSYALVRTRPILSRTVAPLSPNIVPAGRNSARCQFGSDRSKVRGTSISSAARSAASKS